MTTKIKDDNLHTSGMMPAWNGSALTNLPTDRNFIIDGDFTQWPEGDKTSVASSVYTSALLRTDHSTSTGVYNVTQDTDVPTQAESGHQSSYSTKVTVTTSDTSIASTEFLSLIYFMTGSDFKNLHKKECTISFWVKSPLIGQYYVTLTNSAANRYYHAPYTISTANTWEKVTITLTMDTSGGWLFTDADRGLRILFVLMSGSGKHGSGASAWEDGADDYGLSGQVNLLASTYTWQISQFQMVLGSTAPSFTSEPIATVQDQVDYYVQRYNYDSSTNEKIGPVGFGNGTLNAEGSFVFRKTLRAIPTITKAALANFRNNSATSYNVVDTISHSQIGKHTVHMGWRCTGSVVSGSANLLIRFNSNECWIMADARH